MVRGDGSSGGSISWANSYSLEGNSHSWFLSHIPSPLCNQHTPQRWSQCNLLLHVMSTFWSLQFMYSFLGVSLVAHVPIFTIVVPVLHFGWHVLPIHIIHIFFPLSRFPTSLSMIANRSWPKLTVAVFHTIYPVLSLVSTVLLVSKSFVRSRQVGVAAGAKKPRKTAATGAGLGRYLYFTHKKPGIYITWCVGVFDNGVYHQIAILMGNMVNQ